MTTHNGQKLYMRMKSEESIKKKVSTYYLFTKLWYFYTSFFIFILF